MLTSLLTQCTSQQHLTATIRFPPDAHFLSYSDPKHSSTFFSFSTSLNLLSGLLSLLCALISLCLIFSPWGSFGFSTRPPILLTLRSPSTGQLQLQTYTLGMTSLLSIPKIATEMSQRSLKFNMPKTEFIIPSKLLNPLVSVNDPTSEPKL